MPRTSMWLVLAAFLLLAGACSASQPRLEDLWNQNAYFEGDAWGIGSSFSFHFPSMMWEGSEIWAYYIRQSQGLYAVGRARSTDGINWTDDGTVLNGGPWAWTWEAEGASISHSIGQLESGGWSASTALPSLGYMCYGPNTTDIPGGLNSVIFRMMIDVVAAPNDLVATLDVYDNTANTVLATLNVYRSNFVANFTYKDFKLSFTSTAGHQLQFRVYWQRTSWVKVDAMGVAQGTGTSYDDRIASFPGIWKDNGIYYLVYEGAGTSPAWPGDVCLATSTDGLHFTKHPSNPILRHNSYGWESANIGTPSLHKDGSTWYLLYHGYNGVDCQNGIATGTSLTSLTKQVSNPTIPTSSSAWDNGTIGRRSRLMKVGDYYYMAYEGSTDKVNGAFEQSNWSTGLARSADLITWTKFANNPIIPVSVANMGNDGPEMIVIGGITYLYVRSYPTSRYKLVWNPTIPNPPSNPGSASVTQTSIKWTWQDNSSDETGFKVYSEPGAGPPVALLGTTSANTLYRSYTGLASNTLYSFQVLATNSAGDSDRTSNYCKATLASAPSAGNNITCARLRNIPYPPSATFTFSNPAGFGPGVPGGSLYKVSGFRYVWDKSATHTWTGSEATWDNGTIELLPSLGGGNYYLHLKSYNVESVATTTTLNYGPFVIVSENGSIAATKGLSVNTAVTLGSKVLHFRNGGYGYIEEPDRSCGIRVEGSIVGEQDELVYLKGLKKTSPAGEAYIQVSAMSSDVQAPIRPMGMASQRSLVSRVLDGMYVRVWGMVKPGSVAGNSFVLVDGTDSAGVKVITKTTPQVIDGMFVAVDGAAGFDGNRVVYQR